MKKSVLLLSILIASISMMAQDSTVVVPPVKKQPFNPAVIAGRSNDHLLIQVGIDNWAKMPDSIKTKGLSRSFNVYFMFDFPFKTNPHFSIALGAGIATSNIYFEKTYIDISGRNTTQLTFRNTSDTNYYKKYKLLTTYAELPVELRYIANPEKPGKSVKGAIGVKIGTMLSAGTKGKNLLSSTGQNVNGSIQKEKSKKFFNSTRLSVTGRVGYGNFSVFGTYQVNQFIKEGLGPDVKPFAIGLTISGL